MLPLLWAQTSTPDPIAVALLALRRWTSSLTLSSPEPAPSSFGLWAWLAGLGFVLLVAMALQGPGKALGQFLGIPGHVRLAGAALGRVRRSGRPVAILLGTTVLAWTASQFATYKQQEKLKDLVVFTRAKTLGEVATEQGVLAAMVPMRDLFCLGDSLLLLVPATVLVFKMSADRWGSESQPGQLERDPLPGWTTLCWGSTWLYAMYRLAGLVVDTEGLPLGGCIFLEAGLIPFLMLVSDGLLLAWLLVEMRVAGLGEAGEGIDLRGTIALLPAAALACLLTLPGRYVTTGDWLLLQHLPTQSPVPSWAQLMQRGMLPFIRGWGLVELQASALVFAGLAGTVAWGSGSFSLGELLGGYVRLLRAEGGRLVAALAWAGVAAGGTTALAYFLVLSLPPQPWVLAAADSYAHYATLPIGLVLLSGLIELGGRSLPEAGLGDGGI